MPQKKLKQLFGELCGKEYPASEMEDFFGKVALLKVLGRRDFRLCLLSHTDAAERGCYLR